MKITFLGQAGLLFENNNSKIMIDPYFSDSVALAEPEKWRRQPIDERFLETELTALVITHCHADHFDRETLRHFLHRDSALCVLSPVSVWKEVRAFAGNNNYLLFNAGTSVSAGSIRLYAVRAEHSDPAAIGVIVEDCEEGRFYYVTGDTLYSEKVFSSLPKFSFKAVFLPVNGQGNNLNFQDAARFFYRTGAEFAVPVHFGMFDSIDPSSWEVKEKIIPKLYEEIIFR